MLQEIFAVFTIFNFTQAAAWSVDEGWGRSKYERRVNFPHAVYLCCEALRRKADTVVNTLGFMPVNTLEAKLKDCGAEVIAIGDAIAPANILKAAAEAYKAANNI